MATNELLTLTEIFNSRFFRIPDYQRGYAWQDDQLEAFWEDLDNLKDGRNHYTGMLTIENIKKSDIRNQEIWKDDLWLFDKAFKAYHVIDGQQRLTTVIILINVILSKYKDEDSLLFDSVRKFKDKYLFQQYEKLYKSFIFGYEKDNPSDEFFKTEILGQKSSSSDKVPKKTLYTANLKNAKDFFNKRIDKWEKEDHELLLKKLVSGLKFNLYEIEEELDVFVTFETMNNRGKPLSKLELLKNRLIYLTTLLNDSKDVCNRLRKDINETWKTVYEYLGKNEKNPLEDDSFLQNHWIMYFKYERKTSESYAIFLLNEYFIPKNVANPQKLKVGFEEIKNYIDSLAKSVKVWFHMFNPYHQDADSEITFGEETKEWLMKLDRLGYGAFKPLIMTAIVKGENEDVLIELLKACERFNFLVFDLTKRPTNTQNSNFYRMAHRYFEAEIDIYDIVEEINTLTDGFDEDENPLGWFDLDKFYDQVEELYKKYEGFYSWGAMKYFLYEYELYLQKCAKGENKVSWETLMKPYTIEHIYPQTDTNEYWKKRFGKFTQKKKERLLNSLGNLLVLTRSKNSELQNESFDYKKKHLDKNKKNTGYFNGSYSEIEVAQNTEWNDKKIKERSNKLLEFMEERWKIEIPDKEGLLGLNGK
ncbi:MAG: DUF262 domain-containing HNH endonuclease family protein [Clostridiaceae bacterium]